MGTTWSGVAVAVLGTAVALFPDTAWGAELGQKTVAAFDRYVKVAEARMQEEIANRETFLAAPGSAIAGRLGAVRQGSFAIERLLLTEGGKEIRVPDGMVHHWVGMVFVPGATVDEAVQLLQDYDRHAEIYKPAVVRSKLLARNGDRFRVYLRFYMKRVIAVTVNSEHQAEFFRLGPERVHSRIRSTRIAEVVDPGTPREHEKPVGNDGGYLWRLNTYWRFLERDGGTWVRCESITLTRAIPTGFGWLIGPFVTSIPRESLTFTLETTKKALSAPAPRG